MNHTKEIIKYLRCPITNSNLRELTTTELEMINQKIIRRELVHPGGEIVQSEIIRGLTTLDREVVYPMDGQIFILLPELAICSKVLPEYKKLNSNKSIVQNFYNQYGWKKEGNEFVDAAIFEDLRPVTREYIAKCHRRFAKYIKPKGEYILDVASGPIQYPEYLAYSKEYKARVCADFSLLALKEAERKLGDKGIYVLSDITNLPFMENSMDAVISLHTIYHVPSNEQKIAFEEIYRVLKPSSSAAVIYCWNGSLFMRLFLFPKYIFDFVKRLAGGIFSSNVEKQKNKEPELYYSPHTRKWFIDEVWKFKYEIFTWRSVDIQFLRLYIHKWTLGTQILRGIFFLEDRFPEFFGKVGQYPLIVINK